MRRDRKISDAAYDLDVKNDPFVGEYIAARDLTSQDPPKYIHKLEELAYRGSILSILYVADAMRKGRVYERDLKGAEKWYSAAIDAGSVRGLHGLGLTYYNEKKYDQAIEKFQIAISRNYPPAMNSLAGMYFYGEGVARDLIAAKVLWKRGSLLGHFYSKRNYAWALMTGDYGALERPHGILLWMSAALTLLQIFMSDRYTDRMR